MTTTAPAPRATATAPVEERKLNLGRAAAWVFMGLMIFASLFPFYWMLRNIRISLAPSIFPASYTVTGIVCRPAKISSAV